MRRLSSNRWKASRAKTKVSQLGVQHAHLRPDMQPSPSKRSVRMAGHSCGHGLSIQTPGPKRWPISLTSRDLVQDCSRFFHPQLNMYLHFLNFSVPEANGTSHLEPSSSRKYVLILQLSPGQVAGSELLLRVLSGAWPSPSERWLHITALAYTIVSLHCSTADCAREGTASILFSVIFQVPRTGRMLLTQRAGSPSPG